MPSPRLLIVIAIGACIVVDPSVVTADPATQAGSRINVDPQTGMRIPGPTGAVALPPDPAFSTSHSGLSEQPAPGGGVMVDLQGRFRSAATATIGPDEKAHVDCVTPGAARDGH